MNIYREMSRRISWEEIEQHHGDADEVWTVIHGKVYDVTKFLDEHPGGREIMVENAGLDSTEPFDDVGHSKDAHEMLKDYEIGVTEDDDHDKALSGDPWPMMWIPIAGGVLIVAILVKVALSRR